MDQPDAATKKTMCEVYLSESEAASAWAEKYRSSGVRTEYAALIYSRSVMGTKRYYFGRTCRGMRAFGPIRANAVFPFLFLYTMESVKERFINNSRVAAYIHTHPKPPVGFTCALHSKEDLWLLKLPAIRAVYVVPYENRAVIRKPDI